MERVPNEEELLMCPYDPHHYVMRSRYARHLFRCGRTKDNGQLLKCPLNDSHLIPKCEMDNHLHICENRKSFERFTHNDAEIEGLTSTKPKAFNASKEKDFFKEPVACDENWDAEPPVEAYDPLKIILNKDIIRHGNGMIPSQRIDFRYEERDRIRYVRNNKDGQQ